MHLSFTLAIVAMLVTTSVAQYPAPPTELVPWTIKYTDALEAVSASSLLPKPAGKNGPVVARNGHFYTGDKRIRFWGVNLCFAANFPTHQEADILATRLANLGINAVRFHHMDNRAFPSGIFADEKFETLSDEAMDRLDYLIAALKKQGVYSNINLHVSRQWSHSRKWPDAEKLDSYDKVLDIFHPELIAANKQYARDLLTHVNKYTGARYADEPAVCMVEINNEDTIFLWGGENRLAELPERYAAILQKQWNQWLARKYPSRNELVNTWNANVQPPGAQMIGRWSSEVHQGAKLSVSTEGATHTLTVGHVTSTDWHAQYSAPGLKLKKGQFYTLSLKAGADKRRRITLGVSMAHAPWGNLGLNAPVRLLPENGQKEFRFGFVATADDDNARVNIVVGQATGTVTLADVRLHEGGQEGLRDDEDPAAGTVRRIDQGVIGSASRSGDWYAFLQHIDESYWVGMRDFLKNEVGVKAPITGTIALGPLGAIAQAKMDFVDTHAYWDHPNFPRKAWDSKDWLIDNDAMVDTPAGSTFWSLSAARLAGKPFTVTEYNHSAPNDWAAECVPMIASYAALQDWDAVFLFAYSHGARYDQQRISSFFDIEGNPTKIPFLPLAARMFLGRDTNGAMAPIRAGMTVYPTREEMLGTAPTYFSSIWPFVRDQKDTAWRTLFDHRFAISFEAPPIRQPPLQSEIRAMDWQSDGPRTATGRYHAADGRGIVFVGFAGQTPIEVGPLKIEKLQTPFVSLMLVPADPAQAIDNADRLLLAVVGRAGNADMKWQPDRRTVNADWGKGPAVAEIVRGQLSLPGRWTARALTPGGSQGDALAVVHVSDRSTLGLGSVPSLWYELTREAP